MIGRELWTPDMLVVYRLRPVDLEDFTAREFDALAADYRRRQSEREH